MKKYIHIVSLLFLSGCTVVPGMHMTPVSTSMPDYKIIHLTAESIRTYASTTAAPVKAGTPAQPLPTVSNKDYQYRIGPHDVLAVTVWDHPEITIPAGEFRSAEAGGHLVAEDGTIFFPYAGTVHVAGKTVEEVRKMLSQGISSIIESPQIDVKVVAFRSQKAFISGEVMKPGQLPITDVPLTVTEAIGLAGNFTPDADLSNAVLTRNGEPRRLDLLAIYGKGDVYKNTLLQDGDLLYVPDRRNQKVYVMGEVNKPMSVQMNINGLSLTEALGEAGGVAPSTADAEHIYVVRANGDKSEIYHLDAESPDALVLGDQFKLKPMDVVYVEATDMTRYDRTVTQLLSTSYIMRNISRAFP